MRLAVGVVRRVETRVAVVQIIVVRVKGQPKKWDGGQEPVEMDGGDLM